MTYLTKLRHRLGLGAAIQDSGSYAMRNILKVAGIAAVAIFVTTFGAQAASVNILDSSVQAAGNDADVYAAGYGGTTPLGAAWSGAAPLVSPPPGNVTGIFQSPFNNTGIVESQSYFSVGSPGGSGGGLSPATLTFTTIQSAFTMLWGSIDTYNTIQFFNGAASVGTWTGDTIAAMVGLGGSSPNYEVVALLNFFDFDTGFDSILFTSSQAAFEFGLAPVPLPAGLLLFLSGLFGIGFLGRYKVRRGEPASA